MNSTIKSHKRQIIILALGVLLLALGGCAQTPTKMLNSEPPLPVALEVRENMGTIEVSDVISAMPIDQEIGHSHQGLVNFVNGTFLAGSKISEAHKLTMTVIEDELSTTGYNIIAKNQSLFGAAKEADSSANFLLGGEISACKYDSYSHIGGAKSESEVEVLWKLFSSINQSVVFEMTAKGKAEGPEKSVSSLAYAIGASFREFLNDPNFIKSVSSQ